MKKVAIILAILFVVWLGYSMNPVPEPEHCSMCDDLSRHGLCIINLSTGEKLELDIYEPHPFLVGEIAEKQPGGYFRLIRGAGVEGYIVGAEYGVVFAPVSSEKSDQQYFCNSCRERLTSKAISGFALVDLKNPDEPVVYPIDISASFSVRCYSVSVQKKAEEDKYEITITGHCS